jgi:hypothetical protein
MPEVVHRKVFGRDLGRLRRWRRRRGIQLVVSRRRSGVLGPRAVIAEVLDVVAGVLKSSER